MTRRLVALLFAASTAAVTSGCYGTTGAYYDDAYYPYDAGIYYSYSYPYYRPYYYGGAYYRPYYRYGYYPRTYPYRGYYPRTYRGSYYRPYYRGGYSAPRYHYNTPHQHYTPRYNYSARGAPGGVHVSPGHRH